MTPAILLLAVLAAEPAVPSSAPEPLAAPASTHVLHLDEALKTALVLQPSLRQARAQTAAADARVVEARAPLLPQVNLGLGFQHTTATKAEAGGNNLTASLTASQLVWDFGQTLNRLDAARESARAQSDNERGSQLATSLSVRSAFFTAQGTRALLDVALQAVANSQRHVAQAKGFFELGAKPKLDVVQAQSDLAVAQLALIQAENTHRIAKAQLNQAMGREGPADFEVGDEGLPAVEGEGRPFEALLAEASAARPELAQLDSQIRSQQATVRSARDGYFPSIGVSTSVNTGGADLNSLGVNWTVQATLSWQLFQGLATQGQIGESEANLDGLEAQRQGLVQQISLELEQSRLSVEAGKQALASAQESLELARERLDLAEGRYQTGAGSIIELEDAQTALTSAAGARVKSDFDLSVARAQLLKALGRA
jgi:outer membrane protein